jgi:sphinganine-1-phosphate aldolase
VLISFAVCHVVCNRLHLCVTYMHTADGVADRFLLDVEEELAIIMKDLSKPIEGKVSAYLVSMTKFLIPRP